MLFLLYYKTEDERDQNKTSLLPRARRETTSHWPRTDAFPTSRGAAFGSAPTI